MCQNMPHTGNAHEDSFWLIKNMLTLLLLSGELDIVSLTAGLIKCMAVGPTLVQRCISNSWFDAMLDCLANVAFPSVGLM